MSSSRISVLERRRRQLLGQCDEQRLELAYRISQLTPRTAFAALSQRARGAAAAGRNPLTWVAGIAGVLMLLKRLRAPRRRGRRSRVKHSAGSEAAELGLLGAVLAIASRASTILRVIAQLRALYATFQATRGPRSRPPGPEY